MTLAIELTRLPLSEYVPRPEVVLWTHPPRQGEEGIWDILGAYHQWPMIVTVHEREIIENAKKLSSRLGEKELHVTLVLRELTRLHEHAHAYLHTASIEGGQCGLAWFDELPKEVNEPLTEAIAYAVIQGSRQALALEVFEEADNQAPVYYQRWVEIRKILEEVTERPLSHVWIPPLVKFARKREKWRSWQEFIGELARKEALDCLVSGAVEASFLS